MSSAKTILGVLAVGAVGVAVGVLLAPDKGEKTRESIKDSVCDLGDKLRSLVGEGKEKGQDLIKDLKNKAKDLKNDIKGRAENVKEDLS